MTDVGSLELTAGVAVVATALSAFSAFCPPMTDVVNDHGMAHRAAVDFGQSAGAIATVSVGAVLAFLTHNPMPLVVAIAIGFLVAFAYEFALRKGV